MQLLERRGIDNAYERNAICYNMIVYLKKVCEYRLFSRFSEALSGLGGVRRLLRFKIYFVVKDIRNILQFIR